MGSALSPSSSRSRTEPDLGCTAGSTGCGRQEPKRSASSIRIRRRCPPIMTSGRCLCRCDLLVPRSGRRLLGFRSDRNAGQSLVALAKALMSVDPPSATEIDAVIAQTVARQALAAEQARRAEWRQVTERVAEITS
jgi:hypothetical protein